MIRVTVELLPMGSEERKKVIAQALITNDMTGTSERGNYCAWLQQKTGRSRKFGRVRNFRRQTESVWKLISKVIESCFDGFETPQNRYEEELKDRFK